MPAGWKSYGVAKLHLRRLAFSKANPASLRHRFFPSQITVVYFHETIKQKRLQRVASRFIPEIRPWFNCSILCFRLFASPNCTCSFAMMPCIDLALRRMASMGVPRESWLKHGDTTSALNVFPSISTVVAKKCTPYLPKEFLEIIVLVSLLSVPSWDTEANADLDLVEFFAGRARITKLASWCGYRSRGFDVEYIPRSSPGNFKRGMLNRSPMDLNGSAGFALLGDETFLVDGCVFDSLCIFFVWRWRSSETEKYGCFYLFRNRRCPFLLFWKTLAIKTSPSLSEYSQWFFSLLGRLFVWHPFNHDEACNQTLLKRAIPRSSLCDSSCLFYLVEC